MKLRKTLFILPNLFTMSSVFCGLYSIVHSFGGAEPQDFLAAALAIVFAMFFDMVDGRVARLTRTQSEFGLQLDSLADMISFGVAPAILVYRWGLSNLNLWGIDLGFFAAFLFVACGAGRLARFNVLATRNRESSSGDFVGLPIPLAAGMLTSLVLAHVQSGATEVRDQLSVLFVVIVLSYLMVSRVKYRAFKKLKLKNPRTLALLLAIAGAATVVSMQVRPSFALVVIFSSYVVVGLAENLFQGSRSLWAHRHQHSDGVEAQANEANRPQK